MCYLAELMKTEFHFILRSTPLSYVQIETVLHTDSLYGQTWFSGMCEVLVQNTIERLIHVHEQIKASVCAS